MDRSILEAFGAGYYPRSELDIKKLVEEVNNPNIKYWEDGSKILMMNGQCKGIPSNLGTNLKLSILEIEYLVSIKLNRVVKAINFMINRLPPGITVPIHTDTMINNEHYIRFHLPIQTNNEAMIWEKHCGPIDLIDEGEGKEINWDHMPLGYWSGPVHHWEDHSVRNLGETERIHIVVDLV